MEDKEKKPVNSSPEIKDEDFVYVQKDEKIFEKKFKTKPTTFFKDAMKRFVKSRSSVVAAGILAILIGMAIIVPIADQNSIEFGLPDARYLPPKWFDVNGAHFMDGTGEVTALIDPETGLPDPESYSDQAIISGIKTREGYYDAIDDNVKKYGKGGALRIGNAYTSLDGVWDPTDAGIMTKEAVELVGTDELSYTVKIDDSAYKRAVYEGTVLRATLALITPDTVEGQYVVSYLGEPVEVKEETKELSFSGTLSSAVPALFPDDDPVEANLAILINAPDDVAAGADTLMITSVSAKKNGSALPVASFSDATAEVRESKYVAYGSISRTLYHSTVLFGTFRYDYYQAAFGEKIETVSGQKIDEYVAKGWMVYTPNTAYGQDLDPGYFELTPLGETYCPVRFIYSEDHVKAGAVEYYQVHCSFSLYRDLYAQKKIARCEMPRYVFGTDKNGKDFFKLVFSGLLFSLALGALTTAINIVIGLIWGAVSGYFGGWTDIIMERVTEILSGMPWIVLMTLIVLLAPKSWPQFGILLFGLCLTGWIGISGTTRSQFYRYKGREYVLASRTLGASDARLIFRHILPNGLGTIVTSAVLMIPGVIFTEANLAYLLPGVYNSSGTMSFGITLSNVQNDLAQYPYLIVSASIVMALIMISFNLFGNGLRDAFNPSLKGEEN